MTYDIIKCEDEYDWLEKRKLGIGASEAAVVVDESPYNSRLALWAEKTGRVEADDLSLNEKVFWGKRLERTIIDVFAERTGRWVEHSGQLLRSKQYPWAQCTLDAKTKLHRFDDAEPWPLEVKNIGLRMESNWDKGPDPLYVWQIQHQMLVTGAQKATIAALIGGQQLVWCDVDRDEIAIRRLIHAGDEFWRMVQDNMPPEPDGTDSSKQALARIYPEDHGETVNLPGILEAVDGRLVELKEQSKALNAEIRANENYIKAAIGDATSGILPSGDAYSWKLQTMPERTLKASSYRVLRRHKAKKENI